jgi:hypothetical protein
LLHSDAAEENGHEPFLWMVQAGLVLTVHGAQALQYLPTDAKSFQHLPQQVPWYYIKGFFEIHKTSVYLLFLKSGLFGQSVKNKQVICCPKVLSETSLSLCA